MSEHLELVPGVAVAPNLPELLHKLNLPPDEVELLHVGQVLGDEGQLQRRRHAVDVDGVLLVADVDDLGVEARVATLFLECSTQCRQRLVDVVADLELEPGVLHADPRLHVLVLVVLGGDLLQHL